MILLCFFKSAIFVCRCNFSRPKTSFAEKCTVGKLLCKEIIVSVFFFLSLFSSLSLKFSFSVFFSLNLFHIFISLYFVPFSFTSLSLSRNQFLSASLQLGIRISSTTTRIRNYFYFTYLYFLFYKTCIYFFNEAPL